MANQVIHFPATTVKSENSHQVVVTDTLLERKTNFGPYPGSDSVEKEFNNWMQYVTTVTDFTESNLVVAFCKGQLYFQVHRGITAGTELLVWGGQSKIHLQDPSKWSEICKDSDDMLQFFCQECHSSFSTSTRLTRHCNSVHQLQQLPKKNCQCPHCPKIIPNSTNLRSHILGHGINLYSGIRNSKEKSHEG